MAMAMRPIGKALDFRSSNGQSYKACFGHSQASQAHQGRLALRGLKANLASTPPL